MLSEQQTKELKEQIARLEELNDDLAKQIQKIKEFQDNSSHPGRQPAPKSQYLRIAEFLLSRENRPRTARAILKATGISRSSLSQILHRTHKDSFVSVPIPGFSRKKLWSLTTLATSLAKHALREAHTKMTLFGAEGDLSGVKAVDCCAKILTERGGEPMNALTMAREAISRGYKGRSHGEGDEVLLTTAKSFWAALSRDSRFKEVRPLVFALKKQDE
jgi:hypothetical protein